VDDVRTGVVIAVRKVPVWVELAGVGLFAAYWAGLANHGFLTLARILMIAMTTPYDTSWAV
jgi:hypothetical protein